MRDNRVGMRRSGHHARRRKEGGAALVEFALVFPLLITILLGTITGGMTLSRKNSMTNAVREGARIGATLPNSATWASDVQGRVVDLAGGDLDASQVCVELALTTSGGETTIRATGCSLPASEEPSTAAIPDDECVVKVWARRSSDIQVTLVSYDITLDASSLSRYERGASPNCTTS